tara:strand:- start:96 stop:410 length:315 start_codon:yes stop_codon:yes gene_type:complete
MNSKNNWQNISKDLSRTINKVKENFEQKESVEDLKESFYSTIQNSVDLLKSLSESVEKTITDQEIKLEVKETINNINKELFKIKEQILNDLSDGLSIFKNLEEE